MNETTQAVSTAPPKAPTWLGWVLLIGGLIGLICSTIIMAEKVMLLEDPGYITSCDLNEAISCGDVMRSPEASAFGVPNPLIGIGGFAAVTIIGAGILAGGRFRGWFWAGIQAGLTFAVIFCHWLAYSAIFIIRALCPYCMVVWAVSIVLFVLVTAFNIKTFSGSTGGTVEVLDKLKVPAIIIWMAAFVAVCLWEFRHLF